MREIFKSNISKRIFMHYKLSFLHTILILLKQNQKLNTYRKRFNITELNSQKESLNCFNRIFVTRRNNNIDVRKLFAKIRFEFLKKRPFGVAVIGEYDGTPLVRSVQQIVMKHFTSHQQVSVDALEHRSSRPGDECDSFDKCIYNKLHLLSLCLHTLSFAQSQ